MTTVIAREKKKGNTKNIYQIKNYYKKDSWTFNFTTVMSTTARTDTKLKKGL